MGLQALLFDLDQTLVMTQEIFPLRQQRLWTQIEQHFYRTRLPPGTRAFLQHLQQFPLQFGVITSSPSSYARKLLAYHRVDLPVLAAYHDTRRHKPYPDPLLRAAQQLHLPPSQCAYLGDADEDILAAVQAQMLPLGLSWDGTLKVSRVAPQAHAICSNWQEVLVYFEALIQEGNVS